MKSNQRVLLIVKHYFGPTLNSVKKERTECELMLRVINVIILCTLTVVNLK